MKKDKMGFRKENLDWEKVIEQVTKSEKQHYEKELIKSLILTVVEKMKEVSVSSSLTSEEKEVLCRYQEVMVELRNQPNRSKLSQLTSFSFGRDPVEESWEDVDKMVEVMRRQEQLSNDTIKHCGDLLKVLVKELMHLMNKDEERKNDLTEDAEDVIDVQVE
ncbi:MAG: hypothetical protein ABEK17_01205 [Candidatus Aenigmatarchaeota archaeon]